MHNTESSTQRVYTSHDAQFVCTLGVMNEQMQRLYEAAEKLHGVHGKSAVAKLMGQMPQTINGWETRGISSEGLLIAYRTVGCDPLWLKDNIGEMQQNKVEPLTVEQKNWLALLDDLGEDDIAEFTGIITAKQERNRKLLKKLQRNKEIALPEKTANSKEQDELMQLFASATPQEKLAIKAAYEIVKQQFSPIKKSA